MQISYGDMLIFSVRWHACEWMANPCAPHSSRRIGLWSANEAERWRAGAPMRALRRVPHTLIHTMAYQIQAHYIYCAPTPSCVCKFRRQQCWRRRRRCFRCRRRRHRWICIHTLCACEICVGGRKARNGGVQHWCARTHTHVHVCYKWYFKPITRVEWVLCLVRSFASAQNLLFNNICECSTRIKYSFISHHPKCTHMYSICDHTRICVSVCVYVLEYVYKRVYIHNPLELENPTHFAGTHVSYMLYISTPRISIVNFIRIRMCFYALSMWDGTELCVCIYVRMYGLNNNACDAQAVRILRRPSSSYQRTCVH